MLMNKLEYDKVDTLSQKHSKLFENSWFTELKEYQPNIQVMFALCH